MKLHLKLKHFLPLFTILAVAMVMVLAPVASQADVLDFGIKAPTVTTYPNGILYETAGGALVGSKLIVDDVVSLTEMGGAATGPLAPIVNGLLNFTTGNLINYDSTIGLWRWGANSVLGSVNLYGGVDFNNNNVEDAGDIAAGSLLMTGYVTEAKVVAGGGDFKVDIATFFDYKHEALLDFYGLPKYDDPGVIAPPCNDFPYMGNLNISFDGTTQADGTFVSSALYSGDLVNEPVPEPSTLILLGFSLLGMVGFLRRKNG